MRDYEVESIKTSLLEKEGLILTKELIDEISNRLYEKSQNEFAHIVWNKFDIEHLRPEWDEDKINNAMDFCGSHLEDRSIEYGWEILSILLDESENYFSE